MKALMMLFVAPLVACAGEDGTDGADGANGTDGEMGTMGTMGTAGAPGVAGFKTASATNVTVAADALSAPGIFINLTYTPPSDGFAFVTLTGSCIVRHTATTGYDDLIVSIFEGAETTADAAVFDSGARVMLPGNTGNTGNHFIPINAQRVFAATSGSVRTFKAGAQWVGNTSNQTSTCTGRLVVQHHITQLP